MMKKNVLFLCVHNSARSQMAEALLRHRAGDRYTVFSAGMVVSDIHPLALRVLEEAGIPADGLQAKSIEAFMGRKQFEHAIIVCRRAEDGCPTVNPDSRFVHRWLIDDPAAAAGTDEEKLAVFRETLRKIDERLQLWLEETAEAEWVAEHTA